MAFAFCRTSSAEGSIVRFLIVLRSGARRSGVSIRRALTSPVRRRVSDTCAYSEIRLEESDARSTTVLLAIASLTL